MAFHGSHDHFRALRWSVGYWQRKRGVTFTGVSGQDLAVELSGSQREDLLGCRNGQREGPGAGELVGPHRRAAWPEGAGGEGGCRSAGAGVERGFPHLCGGRPAVRFIPRSDAIGFLFAGARAVGGCREKGPGLGDLGAGCCSHPGEQRQWTLTLQEWPGWGAEGQGWAGSSRRQGREPGRLWGWMA